MGCGVRFREYEGWGMRWSRGEVGTDEHWVGGKEIKNLERHLLKLVFLRKLVFLICNELNFYKTYFQNNLTNIPYTPLKSPYSLENIRSADVFTKNGRSFSKKNKKLKLEVEKRYLKLDIIWVEIELNMNFVF